VCVRKTHTGCVCEEPPSLVCVRKTPLRKRTRRHLYVGNLPFKSTIEDLLDVMSCSLSKLQIDDKHRVRIHVEHVFIPHRKEGNRGYGCLARSWTRHAPIDPEDICTKRPESSGVLQVHSRPVYQRRGAAAPAVDRRRRWEVSESPIGTCGNSLRGSIPLPLFEF
jgi:hypothetical protein